MTSLTIPWHAQRRRTPADVNLHYRDLRADEIAGDATTPLRTVVDCLRDEDWRTAISVGDSALGSGTVDHVELGRAVLRLRGPGSRRARERFALLDARAANAFESCARVLLIEAGILGFEPQVWIRAGGQAIGRVDLAHRRLRVVIECDGFETHGTLAGMTRDATRHTRLVAAGWRPLRFTWRQVMFAPEWVVARVRETLDAATRDEVAAQPA